MPLLVVGAIGAIGTLVSGAFFVKETGDSALKLTVPLIIIGGTAVLLANKKALKIGF